MILESDVFVLNPYFRLKNMGCFTVLFGANDVGTWRLHSSFGIILSLCDGERTVSEIAKIVAPFTGLDDETESYTMSLGTVIKFLRWMSFSKEEQRALSEKDTQEQKPVSPQKHEECPLLERSVFNRVFTDFRPYSIEYDPYSFLSIPGATNYMGVLHEPFPFYINWHLTSVCSTDCKYCYLGRRKVEPLKIERLLSLIGEAANIGVFAIDLNGGDVLLHPHLEEVLAVLSERKFLPIALSTKSFLSREKARGLASHSKNLLNEFQFSIDTDDNAIAEYLVGTSGYCDMIFQSIVNALDAGLHVAAKVVITPYNVLTVPRLYRKLKNLGVSKIRLAAYARSGFHHTDDLFLNDPCYQWLTKEVEVLRNEFPEEKINIQNGVPTHQALKNESRQKNWETRSKCTAGRSGMTICSDGKVIPCEQMPETEEYFCGDLAHQSILEIWNGNRLKEMTYGMPREKFRGQPCYDCEEREECLDVMGTCIRDLAFLYGNIYQPPPNCYRHDVPFIRQT